MVTAALVSVLVGAVGCSSTTPGVPNPGGSTSGPATTSADEPTDEPTTSADAPESPLASVDPCELLDAAALSSLGITAEGAEVTVGGARGCRWRVRKDSVSDSYTIGTAIYEELGLKDVVADGDTKEITVNGRDAVERLGVGGTACAVALAVTDTSRVDVVATGADGKSLCPAVNQAAKLVEPELP